MTPEWFKKERGIDATTLEAFGIRFEERGVVFPYSTGEKIRFTDTDGNRRFMFTKDLTPHLYKAPDNNARSGVAFLCEGETDTMRLWQEFWNEPDPHTPAIYGLGGVDTWQPDFAQSLVSYSCVYVLLDNESEYENPKAHAQVERVWRQIRHDVGAVTKVKRVRLPVKDVCEFFENGYDLDSLRLLVQRGQSKSRYKPLDLSLEPRPTDWLVDRILAMGDVHLASGVEGLGKSWLTLGATVSVADGLPEFLGRRVFHQGRVLYVDEENPEDVVRNRLKRLGLKNIGNVRYLWNQGIRVDRDPDGLLEEAIDFEPTLIVLDSLTRIHSGEENQVGDMAPLLNDCIKPLARDTGAAVVLIHHHDKSAAGPRGSGDIAASVDATINMHRTHQAGSFKMKLSKSRRILTGDLGHVVIRDNEDGSVELIPDIPLEPPF